MMAGVCEVTIAVRARPGARRDEIVGVRDGLLVVRISAPALEGRANQALCRLIARRLGIRRSRVRVIRGERWRDKLVGRERSCCAGFLMDRADLRTFGERVTGLLEDARARGALSPRRWRATEPELVANTDVRGVARADAPAAIRALGCRRR
jgi:uncharacterized protein YggU (UPF0235/DUF167 family)